MTSKLLGMMDSVWWTSVSWGHIYQCNETNLFHGWKVDQSNKLTMQLTIKLNSNLSPFDKKYWSVDVCVLKNINLKPPMIYAINVCLKNPDCGPNNIASAIDGAWLQCILDLIDKSIHKTVYICFIRLMILQ